MYLSIVFIHSIQFSSVRPCPKANKRTWKYPREGWTEREKKGIGTTFRVNINFMLWFMTPQFKRLFCPFSVVLSEFHCCLYSTNQPYTYVVIRVGAGFSYYFPFICVQFGFWFGFTNNPRPTQPTKPSKYINIIKRIDVIYQFYMIFSTENWKKMNKT